MLRISRDALADPLAQNPLVRRDLWLSLVSHFTDKIQANDGANAPHPRLRQIVITTISTTTAPAVNVEAAENGHIDALALGSSRWPSTRPVGSTRSIVPGRSSRAVAGSSSLGAGVAASRALILE